MTQSDISSQQCERSSALSVTVLKNALTALTVSYPDPNRHTHATKTTRACCSGLRKIRRRQSQQISRDKVTRRADRFQRRGLQACRSEWRLIGATHNLLKLYRHA